MKETSGMMARTHEKVYLKLHTWILNELLKVTEM